MVVDVLLTPRDVRPEALRDRSVAVFDVLRATTTITAALAAGVAEIRLFDSLGAASTAAHAHDGQRILCGERDCLPPPCFDLGNSPGGFDPVRHAGMTVFMSTTNGTRAMVAARSTKLLLPAALVNATAVAERLVAATSDATLLCAGTAGEPAMEDLLGTGAVIDSILQLTPATLATDISRMAHRLFRSCRADLRSALAHSQGGRNVLAVGLGADIDFAARLDAIPLVGRVMDDPLRAVRDKPEFDL